MPKQLENQLRKEANKLARSGKLKPKKGETMKEAKDRYVYGTLRKTGWRPTKQN